MSRVPASTTAEYTGIHFIASEGSLMSAAPHATASGSSGSSPVCGSAMIPSLDDLCAAALRLIDQEIRVASSPLDGVMIAEADSEKNRTQSLETKNEATKRKKASATLALFHAAEARVKERRAAKKAALAGVES